MSQIYISSQCLPKLIKLLLDSLRNNILVSFIIFLCPTELNISGSGSDSEELSLIC